MIKDAMTGAFGMAAAGAEAIHARPPGSNNDNLYRWLFGDAPTEAEATDVLCKKIEATWITVPNYRIANIELIRDFEKESGDQMNKLDVVSYPGFWDRCQF